MICDSNYSLSGEILVNPSGRKKRRLSLHFADAINGFVGVDGVPRRAGVEFHVSPSAHSLRFISIFKAPPYRDIWTTITDSDRVMLTLLTVHVRGNRNSSTSVDGTGRGNGLVEGVVWVGRKISYVHFATKVSERNRNIRWYFTNPVCFTLYQCG